MEKKKTCTRKKNLKGFNLEVRKMEKKIEGLQCRTRHRAIRLSRELAGSLEIRRIKDDTKIERGGYCREVIVFRVRGIWILGL